MLALWSAFGSYADAMRRQKEEEAAAQRVQAVRQQHQKAAHHHHRSLLSRVFALWCGATEAGRDERRLLQQHHDRRERIGRLIAGLGSSQSAPSFVDLGGEGVPCPGETAGRPGVEQLGTSLSEPAGLVMVLESSGGPRESGPAKRRQAGSLRKAMEARALERAQRREALRER